MTAPHLRDCRGAVDAGGDNAEPAGAPPPVRDRPPTARAATWSEAATNESLPDGIDLIPGTNIALNNLPREYLQSFPYPAFVLVTAVPNHANNLESFVLPRTWSATSFGDVETLTPVWSNRKWANLAADRLTLLECLSRDGIRQFGEWLLGSDGVSGNGDASMAEEGEMDSLALNLGALALNSGVDGSGNGIATPPSPAMDADDLDDADADLDVGFDASATQTISLEFTFTKRTVLLELTKTTVPMYVYAKSEQRRVNTHAFAVITTRPRAARAVEVRRLSEAGQTLLHNAQGPDMITTSPKAMSETVLPKVEVVIDSADGTAAAEPSVPPTRLIFPCVSPAMTHRDAMRLVDHSPAPQKECLYFMREGRSQEPTPPPTDLSPEGLPLDVNELFKRLEPEIQQDRNLAMMITGLKVIPIRSALWWGKDLRLFYNQRYAEQLENHPNVFGKSGATAWAELWTTLGPQTEVLLKGSPILKEDDLVVLKQEDGDLYFESYRSQIWAPFRLPNGAFGGIVHQVMETTERVIEERRNEFLRELAERTANLRSTDEFYQDVLEVMEENAKDAPFALLFTVETQSVLPPLRRQYETAELTEQLPVPAKLWYIGGVGVPLDHPSAPAMTDVSIPPQGDPTDVMLAEAFSDPTLQETSRGSTYSSPSPSSAKRTLSSNGGGFSHLRRDGSRNSQRQSCVDTPTSELTNDQWPFVLALHTGQPVYVEDCASVTKGYPLRVWDELPTSAVVIPIAKNTDTGVANTILVLGLSCRLRFDEAYEAFIFRLRSQLAMQLTAMREYRADQLRIEELGMLERVKSTLFSNVAHELFTPLTLISGPLDDAIMDAEAGPLRDRLVIARRNARRLTRLISIMMDVSNLEAGRYKGSFQLVNLGELTRDSAALFRKAASKAHLQYVVECDTTPHEVHVDVEQWDKILFTLIGNAINFTLEGTIRVSLDYRANEAVLTVQDTGLGIPASDLKFIGESFYRGESVRGRHDGSGITLSFAKKLIELHMGVLEVESKCKGETQDGSHGSTFRVRIPVGNGHLPQDAIGRLRESPVSTTRGLSDGWEVSGTFDDPSENRPATSNRNSSANLNVLSHMSNLADGIHGSSTESDSTSNHSKETAGGATVATSSASSLGSLTGLRDRHKRASGIDPSTLWFDPSDVIMIVDDLHDTRRYLRSILQPFCKVVEARDGKEALEKFDDARPDLIIADMVLPRMNGFELLRQLRNGRREQRLVPFIMLTALDNARPEKALEADDLLSKPFNARELVARAHLQLQIGRKRRVMEELFEERTQELRVVTDSSPVGIFRCTPDGYVSYANQAWYELVGYPPGEVITNWGDYIIDEDQRRVRSVWEEYIESGAPSCSAEWQWKNKRYVSTKVVRLQSELGDGKPCGSIGCSIEITDRILHEQLQKQRVQEAEQRRAEAEEAKFQQELLIDITSHEIRNPISSFMQISIPAPRHCASLVKSNLLVLKEQLQAALEGKDSFTPTHQLLVTIGEDLDALDNIYECGLTQERISNDVLSLGKIQLDKMQMFDVDSSIQREAQKIVSVFQNEARMKRIELSLQIAPSFEQLGIHSVKTDHVRLGQIMTNLLTNAIRFTANSPIRRIELKIDVGLHPPDPPEACRKPASSPVHASHVRVCSKAKPIKEDTPVFLFVSVSDTGPGLNPDELDMLFQRFSQASPKTHTVYGGSGLGLFVCRKLTELLGGRITVASEPNRGSEFSFFIRAKAGAHLDEASAAAARANSPRHSGFAVDHLVDKPRILVVEDNLINRTVLLRQLKHVGLLVDSAEHGQEAFEKIQRVMTRKPDEAEGKDKTTADAQDANRRYDVVLMDLEMPIMDGYTAAQLVRAEEAAGRLEPSLIIALTGNARQVQDDRAMVDFDDIVTKPYRLDNLLTKMECLIRRRLEGGVPPREARRAAAVAGVEGGQQE